MVILPNFLSNELMKNLARCLRGWAQKTYATWNFLDKRYREKLEDSNENKHQFLTNKNAKKFATKDSYKKLKSTYSQELLRRYTYDRQKLNNKLPANNNKVQEIYFSQKDQHSCH